MKEFNYEKIVKDIYKYIYQTHEHWKDWEPFVKSMPIQDIIYKELWKEGFTEMCNKIDFNK